MRKIVETEKTNRHPNHKMQKKHLEDVNISGPSRNVRSRACNLILRVEETDWVLMVQMNVDDVPSKASMDRHCKKWDPNSLTLTHLVQVLVWNLLCYYSRNTKL